MERTLVLLKPDSVKRKIVGDIISRFEKRNFTIFHLKMMNISKDLACEHYFHVKEKPFFNDMINYITSGPVIVMILSGNRVIEAVRSMIGATSNFDSHPGTIRGDYGYHSFENLIHASDSPESAEIEIKRFFPELDI
ncbi:nucleoside-diphosphate kinase [Acetivibrio mesophilus]|uniref:Nucleoside diphosphate kinase n=1 Tax=Acetivibrio mesophilus TaxID=2487273 RepID=A0A4Q0I2G0_9FIRM|nr:nucleoside-diphosphate kinase [Acetivibrio mesophilus]RXE58331.1 nucleoside-diphosphate kinase [Acetivibrio mesophilus]HHV28888.1 nucleoside-diphosphate kinase [Clostridium sp.]